ncbi:MAG: hypothetical protein P4L65_08320 [Legionella sp.]|nr:hypothetical protein [Legionella sp.]
MNISIFDLTLICCTVFFATLMIILMLIQNRKKNIILKAFEKSKNSLRAQIINDEAHLKNTLEPLTTPELEKKISDIIATEKDSYTNVLNLFIDYQPAAIEMMPVFVSKITDSYVECFKQIVVLRQAEQSKEANSQSEDSPREEVLEGDPSEDIYQYEALIEQLRFEKQDYADKYKNAQKLLETIYLTYKDKLEIKGPDTLTNMNLTEIANLFATELTVTSS